MQIDLLVAQVTANAPECPADRINGFLLEFLEQVRLQGTRTALSLDNEPWAADRYSVAIPDNVLVVHSVYVNGREAAQSLTEAETIHLIEEAAPDTSYLIADPYDDLYMVDYDDKYLEILP